MKYLVTLILLVAIGCGASLSYGYSPYKEPVCIPGDKAAAWDEYEKWNNILLTTRRLRQEYCVWSKAYTSYCVDIEIYHVQVENYVSNLDETYTNMCPVAGSIVY
jgi:hypothetical protein